MRYPGSKRQCVIALSWMVMICIGVLLSCGTRIESRGTDARSKPTPERIQFIRHDDAAEVAAEVDEEVSMAALVPNYWISSTGNATAAASWSGGHVPEAGEVAVFDAHSQVDCSTNVATGAVGPDEFIIKDTYYGNIGSSGNYYNNLATNTDKITIRGHGNYYISPIISGVNVIDTAEGTTYLAGIYIMSTHVKRGKVVIGSTAGFRTGSLLATYHPLSHVTIEASSCTTWPAHYVCYAGTIINKDNCDTTGTNARIIVAGGRFRQEGLIYTGTKVIISSGIFEYAPNVDPAAQAMIVYSNGIVDLRDSLYVIPFTALYSGPNGEVWGSAVEPISTYSVLDLSQDYP